MIWDGNRIASYKGIAVDRSDIGESWELSGVKGDESVVAEGEYAGMTLPELIGQLKGELVGHAVYERHGTEFPLLVKFIDARQDLSIQVHPNDVLARMRHGKNGKTEMWYIGDCEPGATLIYGFKHAISKEEFEKRIADNTLLEVCNQVPVHKGDDFFIASGTLHAIGKGIIICEIQQNSNTTYRVFDYGRLGADGKPRALHVEKALDVARLCPPERPAGPMGKPEQNGGCTSPLLAKCGYFTARLLDVAGSAPLCADGESFHSLLCLSGSGAVVCGGGAVPFAKGDSLFLPAGLGAYTIAGRAQLVLTAL